MLLTLSNNVEIATVKNIDNAGHKCYYITTGARDFNLVQKEKEAVTGVTTSFFIPCIIFVIEPKILVASHLLESLPRFQVTRLCQHS